MIKGPETRQAHFAGILYPKKPFELEGLIKSTIESVRNDILTNHVVKALILPHGGYHNIAKTTSFGYKIVQDSEEIKRVYLLGPSKVKGLIGCALSSSSSYMSPMGSLNVCFEAVRELASNNEGFQFLMTDMDMEEEEHCFEVHIPFLIHCLPADVEIIPIYFGILNERQIETLTDVLIPHFDRKDSLFIVTSNFTKWGKKFGFTDVKEPSEEIFENIEKLDKAGMREIEKQDPDGFIKFLDSSKTPIDGKIPLMTLLRILDLTDIQTTTKFVRYSQSNHVIDHTEASISFATGIVSYQN